MASPVRALASVVLQRRSSLDTVPQHGHGEPESDEHAREKDASHVPLLIAHAGAAFAGRKAAMCTQRRSMRASSSFGPSSATARTGSSSLERSPNSPATSPRSRGRVYNPGASTLSPDVHAPNSTIETTMTDAAFAGAVSRHGTRFRLLNAGALEIAAGIWRHWTLRGTARPNSITRASRDAARPRRRDAGTDRQHQAGLAARMEWRDLARGQALDEVAGSRSYAGALASSKAPSSE